jgi:hypothetical protein
MKRLHFLLALTSLTVLLVTIERFSFTTKIILQPYSFLRLHEVVQMIFIILATVVIPFFILKEVTHNFEQLRSRKGTFLALLFIIGIYFYATGNGVHEVTSYLFNMFCPVRSFTSELCGSMFFNDYYFGNILYFVGAVLFTIPLILFERMKPRFTAKKKDFFYISVNALVYAFAIFAYAAFDRVLVGLAYSVVMTVVIDILLFTAKNPYRMLPYTVYAALTYTIGTTASILVRFI